MTGLRKHRAPATRATIPVTTTSLWVKEQETASSPRRTDAVPAHTPALSSTAAKRLWASPVSPS